jgi:DNA-binding HxlR family transcriptional regulator
MTEMLPHTYSDQNCSIARTLEVVGERWTLLILRDAFLGVRRFDDFQVRLGVSRNVLTKRLVDLVDVGIMRREPYQAKPTRYDYVLTEKALDLWPAVVGLAQWGAGHASPDGPPREFIHSECGTVIEAAARCPHCQRNVEAAEAGSQPGPGYRPNPTLPNELADQLARRRTLLASLR